jgi:carboxymethylenebutenolidase
MRIARFLILCCLLSDVSFRALSAAAIQASFVSGGKTVTYEVFGENSNGPLLIYLHGASGPSAPLYRQQAQYFGDNGFTVLFLHYFDATGTPRPSPTAYMRWATAVAELVRACHSDPRWSHRKIALMGLSLGSSVALAAGSQKVEVSAVADWYGSLPDEFFYDLKGMPPLLILHGERDPVIPVVNAQQLVQLCAMKHFTCESHIYKDQGHGFVEPALGDADRRTLDFFSRMLK